MKHIKKIIAGLCLTLGMPCNPIVGQTLQQASNSYSNFNKLRAEGAADADIYSALYKCYQDYAGVLNKATFNSPEYTQSKQTLREIYPYLQNGAAYNSSHGNQQNALLFAQAFIDVPLMDAFRNDQFAHDDYFPTMAYFAASGTFNKGDYARAINYFRVYLDTGDKKNRQNVYSYMAKACMNVKDYDLAMQVLTEANADYPQDYKILSMAINSCIEREDYVNLKKFVNKAVALRPNDETLRNIEGKMYEDTQDYQKALNVYLKLQGEKPNSLNVAKHVALNYYNLGVLNYNKATMEQTEDAAKKFSRQSKEYFSAAASSMQTIVANDPTATMYVRALATAYSCIGDKQNLEQVNNQLASIGSQTVEEHVIPMLLSYDSESAARSTSTPANYTAQHSSSSYALTSSEVPLFSQYAKEYIEARLKTWQTKDPYETVAEYQNRVNETTRNAKIAELKVSAEKEYIRTYTQRTKFNDMLLKPYDAENGVFLVESKFGEMIVPVPRSNNEARVFESSWSGMQFKNPEFYISNDKLLLSALTFVTPTGKTYQYTGDKNLNYVETVIEDSFTPIGQDMFADNSTSSGASHDNRSTQVVKMGAAKSDVDLNIPESKIVNDKTFAVIIANENYDMVAKVPMALNDGNAFGQYCHKTLGLPETNIRLYKDATYGKMLQAVRDIKKISEAYNGDIQVIFYYAGHGIPNESTKDAYLLPVDAEGTQTDGCYSLAHLYSELGGMGAHSVVVFLDACFSGANRDGAMLASARGVALKAKKEAPKGNMVIFSAASEDETAFPYTEKGHGLFTYFLLKKLQESKGEVGLQELGEYITKNVGQQSVVVNRKKQTPSVSASASIADSWTMMKLK